LTAGLADVLPGLLPLRRCIRRQSGHPTTAECR
jgi:hypothetical protein